MMVDPALLEGTLVGESADGRYTRGGLAGLAHVNGRYFQLT